MKIVYLYPELTFVGGNDRVIVDKLNYFADVFHYEVYLITTQQFGKKSFFELSPRIRHLDIGIDFHQQYRHSLVFRAVVYSKLLKKYKERLKIMLYEIRPHIVITTVSRDLDFITDMDDSSKKLAEAHLAKKYVRALNEFDEGGLPKRIIGKYLRNRLEQKIKKLDAFVVLTQNDAENWRQVCRPYVIPNPLPFYPERVSHCTQKKIIAVGRLEYQKGFDLLIESWSLITHRYPDWKISIYGKGTLYDSLNSLIATKNLTKSVIIEEPVVDIVEKYLESSLFVLSSRFEGFGMVLIEAMACGLPVVSFDCPDGPSDIIDNRVDGFLVPANDVNELADKMSLLIDDENLRRTMGGKARQNVTRYSKAIVMEEWRRLFLSLTKTERSL